MDQEFDRRNAYRYRTLKPCRVNFIQAGKPVSCLGTFRDISTTGARIVCEYPVDVDSGISIHLPHRDALFGRVVHCESAPDGFAVGIVFVGAPISLDLFADLAFPETPECFRRLGLDFPCTAAQVRAAYHRKARTAHPDRGGDQEAFVALYRAYRDAIAVLALEEGEPRR
jgi:hypothetical protein